MEVLQTWKEDLSQDWIQKLKRIKHCWLFFDVDADGILWVEVKRWTHG